MESEGCKPELIDSIIAIHDELDLASQQSKLYKGNRPVITQERIIKNNVLWLKIQGITEAAKVIYHNDVPKLKRYLSPRNNSRDQSIKIAPGERAVGLNNGLGESTYMEIKNTGKSALTFFVADNIEAELPENAISVAPGENKTVIAEDLSNSTYGYLVVVNQTTKDSSFIANLLE